MWCYWTHQSLHQYQPSTSPPTPTVNLSTNTHHLSPYSSTSRFLLTLSGESAQVVSEEGRRRGADTPPGGIPHCVLSSYFLMIVFSDRIYIILYIMNLEIFHITWTCPIVTVECSACLHAFVSVSPLKLKRIKFETKFVILGTSFEVRNRDRPGKRAVHHAGMGSPGVSRAWASYALY